MIDNLSGGTWREASEVVRDQVLGAAWQHILRSPAYAREPEALLADVVTAMFDMGERCPVEAMQLIAQRILEETEGHGPVPLFPETVMESAQFWADTASARECEAYLRAILTRLERSTVTPAARKRLLVAMWAGLSDGDRAAFLRRVDPDGQFRRAG